MTTTGRHAGLRAVAIAGVATAFAALPGAANAASVSLAGGVQLTIVADPGEDNQISVAHTAASELRVLDAGAVPIPGAFCAGDPLDPNAVVCTKPGKPIDPANDSYLVDLGDGDDRLDASALPLPGTVEGSTGDDEIFAGEGAAVLRGGLGDDLLVGQSGDDSLAGGGGQDGLDGGPGTDVLEGGEGDDSLTVGDGPDELHGGSGFDIAGVPFSGAGETVSVTLDGVADDGRPGQGANVGSDVEGLVTTATGPSDAAVLRGSAAANLFAGGQGSEDFDPGPGADLVLAGGGDDSVSTVDGHPDTVACGPGTDTATVDRFDTLQDCEGVTTGQIAGAFPGAQPAPPLLPPQPVAASSEPATQVVQALQAARDEGAPAFRSLAVPSRLTRRQLRRGVLVRFAASESTAAEIELSGRLRRGTIARAGDVALVERGLPGAEGARTVRLKLGRAALRAVPRRGRFRLRLRVTLVDAAGNRGTRTRTIAVR